MIGIFDHDSVNSSLSHTEVYTYDSLNRLTNAVATGNSTYNLTFAYDRYGNMTCQTNGQTQGLCPNYSFDQATNRLNTSGFSYDAAGNLTNDTLHTYSYNTDGRVVSIDGGNTEADTYNALGQRVQFANSAGGGASFYGVKGQELGLYTFSDSSWTDFYVYWENRQIAWLAQANEYLTHFIHTNALGSTTQVTDQTGNIATGISGNSEDLLWYPFGAQWTNAGSWADTLFAGMEPYRWGYGLNFTPNRYHAPRLSRWLTPDPGNAGADPSNPQSWNAYSYAGNDPTTNTDPDGLDCLYLSSESATSIDVATERGSCTGEGGIYVNGTVDVNSFTYTGSELGYAFTNKQAGGPGVIDLSGGPRSDQQALQTLSLAGRWASTGLRNAAIDMGINGALVGVGVGLGIFRELGAAGVETPTMTPERAEASEVVQKASGTVGNQTVTVSSRQVAEQAARKWVGDGAEPIYGSYGAGPQVGWKNPGGTRVARWTSAETKGYINLENKTTGGNLHVRWK